MFSVDPVAKPAPKHVWLASTPVFASIHSLRPLYTHPGEGGVCVANVKNSASFKSIQLILRFPPVKVIKYSVAPLEKSLSVSTKRYTPVVSAGNSELKIEPVLSCTERT